MLSDGHDVHLQLLVVNDRTKDSPLDVNSADNPTLTTVPPPSPVARRALGIYYTPSASAEQIATWAIRTGSDVVLEPSFGGCSLLSAAVARLALLGSTVPERQLMGYDVDPHAFVHLSELLRGSDTSKFVHGDFLASLPQPDSVDAVVANPPFIGYRKLSVAQREAVRLWRQSANVSFSADAGLWAYFLIHCLGYLKQNGRVAFLLPGTVASADYAEDVLSYLRWHFQSVQVLNPAKRLFLTEGTAERAAVLLCEGFSRNRRERQSSIAWTLQHELSLPNVTGPIKQRTSVVPHAAAKARERALALLSNLHGRGRAVTLGLRAKPLIGEVLGDTNFFVKTAPQWAELGITPDELKPILRKLGNPGCGIALTADCVLAASFPQLLRPAIQKPSLRAIQYLNSYDEAQRQRNVTFAKRTVWWQVSYDSCAAAFIPSVSNQSVRIVLNEAGISCSNSVYKLIPIAPAWRGLPEVLASFSTLCQLSAELLCRTLGGGGLKLEPSDVRRLLLPLSVDTIGDGVAAELEAQISDALIKDNVDLARELADEAFLKQPGITSSSLEEMRRALQELRSRRLARR